jgi:type I restriction enzyme S subunit
MREDWIESELQFIAKIEWGNTSITKKSYELNGYTAFSAAGPDGFLPQAEWFGEGVVLSAIGANCGKCFYTDGEWAAIKNTIVIQTESVNTKYLFHYLNNKFKWKISGTGQPFITLKNARQNPVPLAPLHEQSAIVAKIEELFSDLDKGIADLKKAQNQLKIYRQAVLKKAFEGELTKDWRKENNYSLNGFLNELKESKNKAIKEKLISKGEYFPNYDSKSPTFNAPQNWLMLPWKTLCSNNKYAMKRGPFGSTLKKAFFVEKGIVVYEQGHAINDDPFRHRYFISSEKFEELKAFETKAGDMIISCSGVTLGRICLLPDSADTGVINQALLKIDMDESVMLKNYFVQLFRSGAFQRLIFQKSLGSAMPNMVGMSELKEIPIPTPSIQEQHQILKEIESRLSVCDKVEESINESLEKANALRQSILKKAFEGTLLSEEEIAACKSAKDYEPATVLLEKIKAEKK